MADTAGRSSSKKARVEDSPPSPPPQQMEIKDLGKFHVPVGYDWTRDVFVLLVSLILVFKLNVHIIYAEVTTDAKPATVKGTRFTWL